MKYWGCLLCCMLFVVICNAGNWPKGKVTFQVIDESGIPLSNVLVSAGFAEGSMENKEYYTDTNGMCVIEEPCLAVIGALFIKDEYYKSSGGYRFTKPDVPNTLPERWEPWNPTVRIVMKKVRNPVPMYHKYTEWIKVPQFNTPVGYDLERGDWVAPYGTGKIADFVFTMTGRYEKPSNAEAAYILAFSNPGDGIQVFTPAEDDRSWFKWPFLAPIEGYNTELHKRDAYLPGQGHATTNEKGIKYIFRVRTMRDHEGQVVSALYGKIDGELRVSRSGKIEFTYWLNPDGTRNLEENPKQNLFK